MEVRSSASVGFGRADVRILGCSVNVHLPRNCYIIVRTTVGELQGGIAFGWQVIIVQLIVSSGVICKCPR